MNDLIDQLGRMVAADNGSREWRPAYVREGDCLTYYTSDAPCHAQRIDGLVTIYIADGTEAIVGCQIKDVAKMLRRFGSFGVEIMQNQQVRMGFLFIAAGLKPESSGAARQLFDSELARKPVDLSELANA